MSEPELEAVQRFRSLGPQLRSTLIHLILSESCLSIDIRLESLPQTCEWLAVVQGRPRSDVYHDVSILMQVKLVHVKSLPSTSKGRKDSVGIDYLCFRVFGKFVGELIRKYPVLDTHRSLVLKDNTKLFVGRELMTPHQVRVLNLCFCEKLESIDVRGLVKLRSLIVCGCSKLKEIVGWEDLRELGWLEMLCCVKYVGYPDFSHLPSLRVCILRRSGRDGPVRQKFDISHCVRLHRVVIWDDGLLEEIGDLSSLKCLEELNLSGCSALLAVTGLSSLHSLSRLDLSGCSGLGSLPDIGHMKELVYIDISGSCVEEILGIGKLVSLKTLNCHCSKLKRLPYLHHLPQLQKVLLEGTPLVKEDPSSFYFDKPAVFFNQEDKSALVNLMLQ